VKKAAERGEFSEGHGKKFHGREKAVRQDCSRAAAKK